MTAKFKIKKNDEVVVTTGKDKGKKGKVVKIFKDKSKVIVSGINMVVSNSKKNMGKTIEKELPIHISNIAAIDPKTKEATRLGYKTLKDGKKVRFAKKSGEVIND